MDVSTRNILLQKGKIDEPGTFPHLDALRHAPRVFGTSFGLEGEASPLDFRWLANVLPKSRVVVVNRSSFNARQLRGLTFEQFLLDDKSDCVSD